VSGSLGKTEAPNLIGTMAAARATPVQPNGNDEKQRHGQRYSSSEPVLPVRSTRRNSTGPTVAPEPPIHRQRQVLLPCCSCTRHSTCKVKSIGTKSGCASAHSLVAPVRMPIGLVSLVPVSCTSPTLKGDKGISRPLHVDQTPSRIFLSKCRLQNFSCSSDNPLPNFDSYRTSRHHWPTLLVLLPPWPLPLQRKLKRLQPRRPHQPPINSLSPRNRQPLILLRTLHQRHNRIPRPVQG
jgi:hypothetical protein